MTKEEKKDYILLAIYKSKSITYATIDAQNQNITMKEYDEIVEFLKKEQLVITQNKKKGKVAFLTPKGNDFIKKDSYSSPNTSIIDLEEDKP